MMKLGNGSRHQVILIASELFSSANWGMSCGQYISISPALLLFGQVDKGGRQYVQIQMGLYRRAYDIHNLEDRHGKIEMHDK
jgi:hypothetical protein